jgi:hypothetical protein
MLLGQWLGPDIWVSPSQSMGALKDTYREDKETTGSSVILGEGVITGESESATDSLLDPTLWKIVVNLRFRGGFQAFTVKLDIPDTISAIEWSSVGWIEEMLLSSGMCSNKGDQINGADGFIQEE